MNENLKKTEEVNKKITEPSEFPLPEKTDGDKHMWTIHGYRIWAKNYQEALMHLDMIESF